MDAEPAVDNALGVDDLLVLAAAARSGDGFRTPAATAAAIAPRVAIALGYDRVSLTLLGQAEPPELPGAIWSRVVEAGEADVPTLIRDLHERPEPELAGLAATGDWRSAAFVPVSARGHLIGTINALSARPREHSAAELDALRAAARVAGVALDIAIVAGRLSEGPDPETAAGLVELSHAQGELTRVALEPSGDAVNAVCVRLAETLSTSVLVWDVPGSKIRAFAGEPQFRSRVTDLLASRDPAGLGKTSAGADLGAAIAHPIGRDRTLGLLVLDPARHQAPSRVEDGLVQHAVALLAFDLEAERAERTARNVSRPSILHALVSGRLSSRQANDVGPFVDATGQAMRIGFLTVADDVTATATSHRLNFSARARGCLAAAAEQDGVLLLVEDDDPAALRTTLHALIESVAPGHWALGMSEPFQDLGGARAALEQAHVALGSAESQQIAFHDEMGPTVALLRHLPPGAAARFVAEILQPLADYDRDRNGALIDTLSAYLRHRGSLRKAADELFVHSNTVQLRLARASQLTGIDLHDPRQLGILSLAFAWRGEPPAAQ